MNAATLTVTQTRILSSAVTERGSVRPAGGRSSSIVAQWLRDCVALRELGFVVNAKTHKDGSAQVVRAATE